MYCVSDIGLSFSLEILSQGVICEWNYWNVPYMNQDIHKCYYTLGQFNLPISNDSVQSVICSF